MKPRWYSQSRHAKDEARVEEGTREERVEPAEDHKATNPNQGFPSSSSPRSPKLSLLDPSSPHHSLESFRAHALRTGLSSISTVYTGTSYEYLTQSTLRPYGFQLFRVGGRGDRGVDLVGVWRIPKVARSGEWKERERVVSETRDGDGNEKAEIEVEVETEVLKVLVQCKRLVGRHAKIGPNLIRELDGAVRGARHGALFDAIFPNEALSNTVEEGGEQKPSAWAGPAIGVLVGTRPATKGVVESMRRSSRGLVWVMMEEVNDSKPEAEAESEAGTKDEDVGGSASPSPSPTEHTVSDLPSTPEPHRAPEPNLDLGLNLNLNHAADPAAETETPPESATHSQPSPPAVTVPLKGRIQQILWNQAARDLGLEGVDVVKRYDSHGREEVVLMRGGRVWGGFMTNERIKIG